MIILGIDPGFAIVGFGILESAGGRQRLVRCGVITTPAGQPLPARLEAALVQAEGGGEPRLSYLDSYTRIYASWLIV